VISESKATCPSEQGLWFFFLNFLENVCRAFFMAAHGKGQRLLCAFNGGARERVVIAVRFGLWRTAKVRDCRAFFFRCTTKIVIRRLAPAPSVAFFAVRREKTHCKYYLPCVVRCGARQRGFTVQNATVCPLSCAPTKNTKSLPCILGLLPCARGTRQSHCFPLSEISITIANYVKNISRDLLAS
jgi:hypothetical protein